MFFIIKNKGQSLVEYIIIIGVVMTAVYIMAPMFKRGTQSVIKATADQLGAQQQAEQDFSEGSTHMDTSASSSRVGNTRTVYETTAGVSTKVNETSQSFTTTSTNGGLH